MSLAAYDPPRLPASELFAAALRGAPCDVTWSNGTVQALPVGAWVQVADSADRLLLESCVGTTIDIGCGPGRMSAQLMLAAHVVLGIDVVPEAVEQARARGVSALQRDVFDPVPGEGRWETALLADGNIGIGGDPVRLLGRVRQLLAHRGRVVVELAAYGAGLDVGSAVLSTGGRYSHPFPWAAVGADAIAPVAAQAGLVVSHTQQSGDRWWSVLTREG